MSKVSIVVPVYQAEMFLSRCLRSIIAQSYKNIEILLIDDGSSDEGGKICDQYLMEDNRVFVIHKKNKGLSNARNTGISLATGKWLMFCDDDDKVISDWVETLYFYAERNIDKLITCEFYNVSQNGVVSSSHLQQYKEVSLLDNLDYGENWDKEPFWFVWNKIFLLQRIKDYRIYFDETLNTGGEDVVFVVDYLLTIESKMIYIPKPCYYWIDNDGSSASRKENPYEYLKLRKTCIARKRIIPKTKRRDFYNKELYLMLKLGLGNAIRNNNILFATYILKDRVFREVLFNSEEKWKFKLLCFLSSSRRLRSLLRIDLLDWTE